MHDNDMSNRRVDASPYVAQTQPAQFQPAPFVAPQPIIPPLGAQAAPGYGYPQPAPAYPQHAPPVPSAAPYQPPQPAAAPGAPPQRAEPMETDDYSVVVLSKAYKAHDVDVQRVKLRKPETTVGSGSPEEGRRVEVRVQ